MSTQTTNFPVQDAMPMMGTPEGQGSAEGKTGGAYPPTGAKPKATFGKPPPEVIGEIYECNFEHESFTVVSFSVPIETRWRTGKYKIVRMGDI